MNLPEAYMRSFKVRCPNCNDVVEFYRVPRSKTAWMCSTCDSTISVDSGREKSELVATESSSYSYV